MRILNLNLEKNIKKLNKINYLNKTTVTVAVIIFVCVSIIKNQICKNPRKRF